MKIGAIFLISVMALAAIGGGYAAWFDTITVEGTVNTGSVGWDVIDYSGTDVYKVYNLGGGSPEGEILVWDWPADGTQDEGQAEAATYYYNELISCSYAEQTIGGDNGLVDDSVTVVFSNLFPCIEFEADFTIKYTGTVPGKINAIGFDLSLWDDLLTPYVTVTLNGCPFITNGQYNPQYELGYQLHEDDLIHVVITIHLLQDNTLMNLGGSFDVDVEVVQWNEYPYIHT